MNALSLQLQIYAVFFKSYPLQGDDVRSCGRCFEKKVVLKISNVIEIGRNLVKRLALVILFLT